MNVFEKEKKDCVGILSSKTRPKKGRKHSAVNQQSTPSSSGKASFYNHDEWL